MADREKIELIIAARNTASKAMTQLTGQVNTLTKRVFNLKTAVIGLGGVYAVDRLVDKFERLSDVQEKAEAGMRQAMVSMGRYTDELHRKMLQVASDIQSKTTFGDEAIIQGQKFLMTYRDITDDLLPRTSAAMADLAALMGGDTKQAANMLGKASMGLTGELRRAGITVDENTFKAKGFLGVLEEIEQQVRGQARVIAATRGGGLEQFGNIIGDVEEKLGYFTQSVKVNFTDALTPAVKAFNAELEGLKKSGKLDEWADNAAVSIASLVETGIHGMGDVLNTAAGVVRWIESHQDVAQYGLIGWLLWGKKGALIGAAAGAAGEGIENAGGPKGLSDKIRQFLQPAFDAFDGLFGITREPTYLTGPQSGWVTFLENQGDGTKSAADTIAEGLEKAGAAMKKYRLEIDKTKRTVAKSTADSADGAGGAAGIIWQDIKVVRKSTDGAFNYMEEMSAETARHMQNNFSDLFFDGITGRLDSLSDYWKSFSDGLTRIWSDMVARMVATWLMGEQYMAGKSSTLGGLLGLAAKALGAYLGTGDTAGPVHVGEGGTTAYGMHSGGIAGREPSFYRTVPAAIFANAPRYHGGIGPGERAAVIRDDEGVFTPGQMKALGKASGGGTTYNITNIHALDAASFADLCRRNRVAVTSAVYGTMKDNIMRTQMKGVLNR